jgi:hypothetical protein
MNAMIPYDIHGDFEIFQIACVIAASAIQLYLAPEGMRTGSSEPNPPQFRQQVRTGDDFDHSRGSG